MDVSSLRHTLTRPGLFGAPAKLETGQGLAGSVTRSNEG